MRRCERSLREADGTHRLLRIERRGRGVEVLEGFCVGLGEEWFVLHAVRDVSFENHVFLRLRDLRDVEDRGSESFTARALRHQGTWPPEALPEIGLGDVTQVLEGAGARSPLVTIHTELEHPNVCFIGRPVRVGKRSLRLLEVDPEAAWAGTPTRYDLDSITRVEIGGAYERLLGELAGPPGRGR